MGLAGPGWHLTWVHGAKQMLREEAERQTAGLHEPNHSGSQLFLSGEARGMVFMSYMHSHLSDWRKGGLP